MAKPNPTHFTEVKGALDVAVSILSQKKGGKTERKQLLEILTVAQGDAPFVETIIEAAVKYVRTRHPEDCPCDLCTALWRYEQRLGHLFVSNRGGNMLCAFKKASKRCNRFREHHPRVIRTL